MFKMNIWLIIAVIFLLEMIPCIIVAVIEKIMERFVAFQMVQVMAVLVMLLLAQGFNRDIYFDLAVTMSVLALASGLVYARFLERWL